MLVDREKFIAYLKSEGCYQLTRFKRGPHEKWYNPKTEKTFAIPRGRKDLKNGTVNAILKEAGLK